MTRKPDVAGFPPCENTADHDGTAYKCDLADRHDGDCLDTPQGRVLELARRDLPDSAMTPRTIWRMCPKCGCAKFHVPSGKCSACGYVKGGAS